MVRYGQEDNSGMMIVLAIVAAIVVSCIALSITYAASDKFYNWVNNLFGNSETETPSTAATDTGLNGYTGEDNSGFELSAYEPVADTVVEPITDDSTCADESWECPDGFELKFTGMNNQPFDPKKPCYNKSIDEWSKRTCKKTNPKQAGAVDFNPSSNQWQCPSGYLPNWGTNKSEEQCYHPQLKIGHARINGSANPANASRKGSWGRKVRLSSRKGSSPRRKVGKASRTRTSTSRASRSKAKKSSRKNTTGRTRRVRRR